MKLTENNLLGVVNELRVKGFSDDFIVENNALKSTKSEKIYQADAFRITNAYRFDIEENTSDTQNLYTIETADGKGLLIDMMAHYLNTENSLIAGKLETDIEIHLSPDLDMKYGMEKIYKSRFAEDPDRYELRTGYPDFPPCPFGNSFRMLGYDKKEGKYVWMVTSILRDKRLKTTDYQVKQHHPI